MGFLDDAKDKLGDAKEKLGEATEWAKDRAEQLGAQAQGAGQTLGEKAADAKHWVEARIGDAEPEARQGGGGEFTKPTDASAESDSEGTSGGDPA